MYHFNRLNLSVIQWMRLKLYLRKIYMHEVYAADITVPCCTVIEFHRCQISDGSELSSTRKTLWYISPEVLASDRYVKVVQYMEGLNHCLESIIPYRSCCLEESGSRES